jgi:hypothetical protein
MNEGAIQTFAWYIGRMNSAAIQTFARLRGLYIYRGQWALGIVGEGLSVQWDEVAGEVGGGKMKGAGVRRVPVRFKIQAREFHRWSSYLGHPSQGAHRSVQTRHVGFLQVQQVCVTGSPSTRFQLSK